MNQTFNARRFSLLFKKTILERPAQILGLWALTLFIILLVYFLLKNVIGFEGAQFISFILGMIGGGAFLASLVFGYFSSNASSASYLTLPASQFEKWLCGVIIAGLLYVLLFLLFYRGIDSLFIALYHQGLDPQASNYRNLYDSVYLFPLTGDTAEFVYISFLNIAGAMMVGSLYFNKASFIKVALLICAIIFFTFLLNYLIASVTFDHVDNTVPFHNIFIRAGKDVGIVELPTLVSRAMKITSLYILPAILWALIYIRLKEKEI